MEKRTIIRAILAIIFTFSVLCNVLLSYGFSKSQTDLISARENQQFNLKVLEFRNLFTRAIILSSTEVDFDTRLALETSVRALNDQEIFGQWKKFTAAKTKEDASLQAKQLLELLIEKTSTSAK
jgi:hypothetical protein